MARVRRRGRRGQLSGRAGRDGSEYDELRYLVDPFQGFEFGDFAADGVRGDWAKEWAKGSPPA